MQNGDCRERRERRARQVDSATGSGLYESYVSSRSYTQRIWDRGDEDREAVRRAIAAPGEGAGPTGLPMSPSTCEKSHSFGRENRGNHTNCSVKFGEGGLAPGASSDISAISSAACARGSRTTKSRTQGAVAAGRVGCEALVAEALEFVDEGAAADAEGFGGFGAVE